MSDLERETNTKCLNQEKFSVQFEEARMCIKTKAFLTSAWIMPRLLLKRPTLFIIFHDTETTHCVKGNACSYDYPHTDECIRPMMTDYYSLNDIFRKLQDGEIFQYLYCSRTVKNFHFLQLSGVHIGQDGQEFLSGQ